MRWREDIPLFRYGVVIVAVPIILPVMAVAATLFGAIWLKRRLVGPTSNFQPWFAWYPVRITLSRYAWLEWVDRRSDAILATTEHRAPLAALEGEDGNG